LGAGREQGQARLVANLASLGRSQLRYQELLNRQQALETEWKTTTDPSKYSPPPQGLDPPRPPPDFTPSPPSFGPPQLPPEARGPFGSPARGESRGRIPPGEIRRHYWNLETERVALEAKIVEGQVATTNLIVRLDAKQREIERRRE